MSSSPIISVQGLGKKYRIKHQAGRPRYKALRDVLTDKTKGVARRLWSVARGQTSESRGQGSAEDFWALKEVSFEVRQGEVVGIIGRNGTGKSTLLKILSRITEPTTGRVEIDGRVASLLEVGTGFHPELTGRENIFLNGAILGMHRAEIKKNFDEIVAFAEVEKFLDTPVKRYSSGMYVRLAFAVAAHLEPEILIVDEVLAVGDGEFQKKCLGKMREVSIQQGRTVLFVSHQMAAIQQLTQKCMLLARGEIADFSDTSNVVRQYLNSPHHESTDSTVELSHLTPRDGNGHARLLRLEILDLRDQPTKSVPMLGGVKFRLTCNFSRKCGARFGIFIHSASEDPMLDLRNSDTMLACQEYQGNVTVETVVKTVRLYPGEYLLSLWIADSACQQDLDYVRYCCRMTVQPPVFEDRILKLDPAWGKFYSESEWKISS